MINKIFDAFKKKALEEQSIWFHPGIYRFYFPYTSFTLVPNEDQYTPVYTCEVQVHVGMEHDMKEGKLATIIIKADDVGIGVTNFIEDIASKIRLCFFDKIFHDDILKGEPSQLEGNLRWLEYYSPSYYPSGMPEGSLREVKMTWDDDEKRYSHPDWFGHEGIYKDLLNQKVSPKQGEIYQAQFNVGRYPTLGYIEKVLVLNVNKSLETVLIVPITSHNYKGLRLEELPIFIGENLLEIDPNDYFVLDKITNINNEHLINKIGVISKDKYNEVVSKFKSLLDL